MIEFNVGDPFPLVDVRTCNYSDNKAHASAVDNWLGYQIEKIEKLVSQNTENKQNSNFWINLKPDALQTPYIEFRQILNLINPAPTNTIVDVGAAYGRLGHVIAKHYPENKFIGIESVSLRFLEAQRIFVARNYKNAEMVMCDVSQNDFVLPKAEIYFIYDFGSRNHVSRVLCQLSEVASQQKITVIGRGRLVRDLIEHEEPWLSQVVEPRHFKNFSIYQTEISLL